MARLSPMAASSHQCSLHRPALPSPCSSSSSAVLCAVRICPNPATATSTGISSFSVFSSPVHFGARRKRTGAAANAYTCCPEGSASYNPSPHLRLRFSAFPRGASCPLSCKQGRHGSFGWGKKRTASSVCCGGTGGGGHVGVKQVEQELESKGDVDIQALEAEIYEFMQKSAKPSVFPTKEELIAARRVDLVDAIVAHGGWLAYGWDLDDGGASGAGDEGKEKCEWVCEGESRADAVNSYTLEANSTSMKHNELSAGWVDKEILQQQRFSCAVGSAASSSSRNSSSGGPIETGGGEESGIEGILSRLEKKRSSLLTLGSTDKKVDSRMLSKIKDYDLRFAVDGMARGSRSISLDSSDQFFPDFDGAGGISPNGNIIKVDNLNGIPMDDYAYLRDQSAIDMRNGSKEPSSVALSDQNKIHSHLRHLESELSSVLGSLRSRADAVVAHKIQESSVKELHRLSDAWEFQETEIMNARDKLRSTSAKLAILEGKMALEIIESQKIVEEKQERIDAAQRALRLLRTAYVVWPNLASEVLLAGSFDGWGSQRKMERSSTGIFSLYLKLYPGQYEIKFVVDGVWKVDPLRPIVYNNGFENNLLVIS